MKFREVQKCTVDQFVAKSRSCEQRHLCSCGRSSVETAMSPKTNRESTSLNSDDDEADRNGSKINNTRLRIILRFFFDAGNTAQEAFNEVNRVYPNTVKDSSTCRRWWRKWRERDQTGNDNEQSMFEDAPRSGRPRKVNIQQLTDAVKAEPKLTLRQLGAQFGVSRRCILTGLQKHHFVRRKDGWKQQYETVADGDSGTPKKKRITWRTLDHFTREGDKLFCKVCGKPMSAKCSTDILKYHYEHTHQTQSTSRSINDVNNSTDNQLVQQSRD